MQLPTLPTLTLTSLIATLAASTPILKPRQGTPPLDPIPSNCTVINPLPGSGNSCSNITSGYRPTANFTSTHGLWSAYYSLPDPQAALATQCLEQCNGESACKSAIFGMNVPVPEDYMGGTAAGELAMTCLTFDEYLDALSFEAAPAGQWVNETGGSIYC
jgi:hypothetical protein